MIEVTRKEIVQLAQDMNCCHVTSALSIVEIINTVYRIKDKEDQVILSKGHGCLALYVMLRKMGFKPLLFNHPDLDVKNGIMCTSGSLGHGLPIAVGKAIASPDKRFFVVMGDGELQEGTVWESLLIIEKYKINNVVIVVDRNYQQSLGWTSDILPLNNLRDKFLSFGMEVRQVDGHNGNELSKSLIRSIHPKVVIACTVKGKGLRDVEGRIGFHVYLPKEDELI